MGIRFINGRASRGAAWIVLLTIVLLGAGLLHVRQLAAQGEEQLSEFRDEGLEQAPQATSPELAAEELSPSIGSRSPGPVRLYLPLLRGRPQFTAQFATEVDGNLNPVAPTTEFAAGTRSVYAVIGLNGLAGQRWSTAWYRNNLRIPGLVASGTVPAGQQEARLVRRLSYANNGPLPAGTYKLVVSINDRRAFEAELLVRP